MRHLASTAPPPGEPSAGAPRTARPAVDLICDTKGRFLTGGKPGPGRKVGSRNALSESFVADLKNCWELHGRDALDRVARDQPEVLLKVVASLMPKDVNLSIGPNAASFAETFQHALSLLGNSVEPPRLRRPLRTIPPKVIEHGN
ncbi:hypothetical protein [Bradyrhizobium sp. Ash2021]|uniref:hypothetical protein n=1 Tax=Bradyrhizobium sp. Ash2021 TaxID=2954771 RepID=UPI0028156113|nr:hypothetical protein [Bradyrhizobium sp. Ash2021]WMT78830.1 hypothetical protein NL528_21890 [Bradyrhizobium sp. Ash2021]